MVLYFRTVFLISFLNTQFEIVFFFLVHMSTFLAHTDLYDMQIYVRVSQCSRDVRTIYIGHYEPYFCEKFTDCVKKDFFWIFMDLYDVCVISSSHLGCA